mmetsp:Transcript_13387/g.19279  ORF Transcript_13387/g.19279 Transcript_13387/m.19279 type:complete len:86 (+) Transcript_13387:3-260(+)
MMMMMMMMMMLVLLFFYLCLQSTDVKRNRLRFHYESTTSDRLNANRMSNFLHFFILSRNEPESLGQCIGDSKQKLCTAVTSNSQK